MNTGARLQSQARSGEIVLSRTTWHRLAKKPVHVEAVERAIALKGKAEPMPVVVLAPVQDAPAAA